MTCSTEGSQAAALPGGRESTLLAGGRQAEKGRDKVLRSEIAPLRGGVGFKMC